MDSLCPGFRQRAFVSSRSGGLPRAAPAVAGAYSQSRPLSESQLTYVRPQGAAARTAKNISQHDRRLIRNAIIMTHGLSSYFLGPAHQSPEQPSDSLAPRCTY